MKTLDALTFNNGLSQTIDKLQVYNEQLSQIETSILNISSLTDSLKGSGGQAIRLFYQDMHQPFIAFFQQFIDDYKSNLQTIKSDLSAMESSQNGFIKQHFLQNDVENGLNAVRNTTTDLTNEANQTMSSVQDIVSLPRLDDQQFNTDVRTSQNHVEQTIEKLNQFDQQQQSTIDSLDQNVQMMKNYVNDIQTLFNNGTLSVDTYNPNVHYPMTSTTMNNNPSNTQSFYNHPRAMCYAVDATDPNHLNMEWDPTPTLGLNFEQWKDQPINAGANLFATSTTALAAAKKVNLARQGFGIKYTHRVTAQKVRKPVVKIDKPELANLKKQTYSGAELKNHPRLYKMINPAAAVKDSFKWASNKLGYIGLGATVVGNITHGVQNNQSESEITGNIVGDVAVAGMSMAAAAAAGAKVGTAAGALGGPIGVATGAVFGALAGIIVTTMASDFKFMDVDGDGKLDSVGDALKKGTTGLIDKIGSWFK
ncbi:LXG domain-containing protein [Cytobacillus sp. Sa5YUA1]|uniref:LXG domain-containing protein n=1 Tax=Cytobacillus stercorigallinarum TaxID=2762240 RepID=A0ABR8QVX2_9BACI|nr:LXG domain-containing protein [Cytobacillus stercorigallinarum]MBD7939695.1 LXG domain-containing protein [Cytobacillus stercorigallinarum]